MKFAHRKAWIARLATIAVAVAACGVPLSRDVGSPVSADILLFVGRGTWSGDVAAVEEILRGKSFRYSTASSEQLNAMSEAQLHAFRLLIVPGGNFEKIGKNLTPDATANIRRAVKGGLNYLGLCAGAFFAGNSPYNGLDLTTGVRFNFYAMEAQGVRKAAVPVAVAGAGTSDHYWEDGPQLSGWGEVVARYPDGTPAIAQGSADDGWVILTGTHPEAPERWREGMAFAGPASETNAYAASLIDAALNGIRLDHY
jgi:glutamine amidotransferase-like uncharacterized protein